MENWLQHLLVLLIVALSAAFVLWQIVRTLRLRGGKVGSCCSKGCEVETVKNSSGASSQRIAFLPAEMLIRKR